MNEERTPRRNDRMYEEGRHKQEKEDVRILSRFSALLSL